MVKIDELPNHRAYQLLQGGVQEMVMNGTLLSVLRTGRSRTPIALVLPLGDWLEAAQEQYGDSLDWDVYTVSAIKEADLLEHVRDQQPFLMRVAGQDVAVIVPANEYWRAQLENGAGE